MPSNFVSIKYFGYSAKILDCIEAKSQDFSLDPENWGYQKYGSGVCCLLCECYAKCLVAIGSILGAVSSKKKKCPESTALSLLTHRNHDVVLDVGRVFFAFSASCR